MTHNPLSGDSLNDDIKFYEDAIKNSSGQEQERFKSMLKNLKESKIAFDQSRSKLLLG